MVPWLTPSVCAGLRTAFQRAGFDVDGVPALLGPSAHAALSRDEPVPARMASADAGPLGTLIRLFLLGDTEPEAAVAEALAPVEVGDAVAAKLLRAAPGGLAAALDVRPHGEAGWWVVSDQDTRPGGKRSALAADHVLGVGQASLTLAAATVRRPAGRVLDLGTGCGVQALHAAHHAGELVATDINQRALALAAATFALSDVPAQLRAGAWLEPVAGDTFDQIVCNPPFVTGPPRVRHTYRDSGLAGDTVAARLVGAIPRHLNDGGVAQLLACWLHVKGQDWPERVTSWLPGAGDPDGGAVDAWFVQREVADPALYVGTWLRDSGLDPASPEARRESEEWLTWFDANQVEGVGFGFITLRRTGSGSPTVLCEDLLDAPAGLGGDDVSGWLDRVSWLRDHPSDAAVLGTRMTLAPGVLLEEVSSAGPDGWAPVVATVRSGENAGWRHEVDSPAAALLAGCQGALSLGELIELLSAAYDRSTDELVASSLPAVRELVRHGLLIPSG
ncbi:MAG TPA: methyltransferase [Pseudonocardia sp.]|nr:methyltransferase [Pseudonocardia sp.]